MQHEQALSRADFAKPFEELPRGMPLGAEPLLVVHIQASKDGEGRHVLGLLPQQGQGVHLTLDDTLLHSFCKLVQNAVAASDWNLALELPALQSASAAGGDTPRSLN